MTTGPGARGLGAAAVVRVKALVGAVLLSTGLLAWAQTAAADLPGQAAPAYQAAVQDWLDDDEEAALTALSALSHAGNPSAQLLLALIDKTPSLQGPWLSRQDRATRIALMRAPGGLSGLSWIDASAQSLPIAALWRAMWRVDTAPEVALEFARAGEARAAREALLTLAARERRGLSDLLDDPDYPASMRWLGWREWDDPAAMAEALEALHPGDPQRLMLGQATDPDARVDWLFSAPEGAPVTAFCTVACGASARACALALDTALGSPPGLLVFGTPSATLIPDPVFVTSARGRAALLRRVLLSVDARGRRALLARAEATDACTAAALNAEAERHRHTHAPVKPAQ